MSKRPTMRVSRDQRDGIEPGSYGRRSPVQPLPTIDLSWASRMLASDAGAAEVMVKISGGGRDAETVQAHLRYIGRHGKLELETDAGETLQGRQAAQSVIDDWAIDYGSVPGQPHARKKGQRASSGASAGPRQAFNIILSMPPSTPPNSVLQAARKFARENFAYQYRYAMALHAEDKDGHGKHPHVHLVVKAEHEYGGSRLSPRKPDLQRWREQFAGYMTELGVAATATRRMDRGLIKTQKKNAIYRAMLRGRTKRGQDSSIEAIAGSSRFLRTKAEQLQTSGAGDLHRVRDQRAAIAATRDSVGRRYLAAIGALREQGRVREAQRMERMLRALAPIQTEQQKLAEALAEAGHLERPGSAEGRNR